MTPEELKFLEDNRINFESVKLGFTRNIPFPVLETYEALYRKYLDSQFVLTYWCGECVFEMLKRLIHYVETHTEITTIEVEQVIEEAIEEPVQQEPKKRGRKKKITE